MKASSLLAMTVWGGGFGYLAGFTAFLLHPLAQQDGVQLFVDSLRIGAPEALVAIVWFPVKLLSWLYGAMAGFTIGLLLRKIDRSQRQSPIRET